MDLVWAVADLTGALLQLVVHKFPPTFILEMRLQNGGVTGGLSLSRREKSGKYAIVRAPAALPDPQSRAQELSPYRGSLRSCSDL